MRGRRETLESLGAEKRPDGYRGRLAFGKGLRELVEHHKGEVLSGLMTDEVRQDFIAAIKRGVKANSRTEMIQYAQLTKLVDQEHRLVVEFVHSLGVAGEAELRRMVEAVKGAEGADLLTSVERSVTFLEAALPMLEEHRAMVIKRLGGYLPVTSDSLSTENGGIGG
jgi:hypothetical protein